MAPNTSNLFWPLTGFRKSQHPTLCCPMWSICLVTVFLLLLFFLSYIRISNVDMSHSCCRDFLDPNRLNDSHGTHCGESMRSRCSPRSVPSRRGRGSSPGTGPFVRRGSISPRNSGACPRRTPEGCTRTRPASRRSAAAGWRSAGAPPAETWRRGSCLPPALV